MDRKDSKTESIFETGEIQYVVFDADDTLFDTGPYYREAMLAMGEMSSLLISPKLSAKHEAERIFQRGVEIHKQVQRPMLLNLLLGQAIESIYGTNYPNRNHVENYLKHRVEQFYKQSPRILPGVLPVLEMLDSRGIQIGIHSHAQEEWTEIKVEYLRNRFFDAYGREITVPYYTTSIDSQKNEYGWKDAINYFGFTVQNTLVVGDNLRDDILAAHTIGVPNLVLISGSRYASNTALPSDIQILRVEQIEDILNL